MQRFTIEREEFPDPNDKQSWNMCPLFPGKELDKAISYQQQLKALQGDFSALDLCFSKVTHIFRVAGARYLDEQGIEDQVRI